MKIQIKSIAGSVLFEGDFSCLSKAVEAAVASYADLSSANLRYADLRSANLRSADLRYADLRYADLRSANLRSADLRYADLRSANLRSANLRYADLRYADLRSANLRYADLSSADLSIIKHDLWAILIRAPHEVAALRTALSEGRVNGSTYEGECACLVGTIANAKHCNIREIGNGFVPDADRPAERFFLGISKGDTPATNQAAKIAVEWIDEWSALTAGLTAPLAK